MPAYTPFLTLYKPGGGSTGLIVPDEVVDVDRLNANSDLIDAFAAGWGHAAERNHNFYGPAASRSGISGMKPGDTYQESDEGKIQWVQSVGGIWRVLNSPPVALTLNAGWTNPGGIPATYEVRSGLLMLWGRLSGTTGAGAVVATLPPDYRPLQDIVVMYVDGATLRDFIIGAAGTLTAYGKGAAVVADMRLSTVPPFAIK